MDQIDLDIALKVLRYLSKRPEAKDTIEGIAKWWLIEEQIEETLGSVDRALSYLISRQFLVPVTFRNQETYYQLNKERLEDIRALTLQNTKAGE